MKKYLFASVASLVFAVPAFAQDAAVDPAMTGFRVEGRIGADVAELNADYSDGLDDFDGSESETGVAFGGEIGFDIATGNTVIGAYAGVDFATTESCTEVFGEDEACVEAGRNITVGARAGTRVGRGLLYAKGGYSNGKLKASYEDFEGIIENFRASDELDGFHLGAGGEFPIAPNSYAKLEYVYTNYSGASYSDADFDVGADLERHQLFAAIGFRF